MIATDALFMQHAVAWREQRLPPDVACQAQQALAEHDPHWLSSALLVVEYRQEQLGMKGAVWWEEAGEVEAS